MKDLKTTIAEIIDNTKDTDLAAIRRFFFEDPSRPLIAIGSGAAETAADYAALLYGARGGFSTAVSPYTLNSYSDEALKTAKLLLVSAGGHNNDIVFAAKRALAVNPEHTASFTFSQSDRNEVRKLFQKAGNPNSFDLECGNPHDGFVAVGTPLQYFALLTRIFNPGCDLRSTPLFRRLHSVSRGMTAHLFP